MKKFFSLSLAFLFLIALSPSKSFGWDEHVKGEINVLAVTDGENLGLRVSLKTGLGRCLYAFINESDSNYKSYLALLTTAATAKKEVALWLNIVDSVNKSCKIGFLSVSF